MSERGQHGKRRTRAPTLRGLVAVSTVAFGIMGLLVVVALVAGSTALKSALDTIIRDTRSQAIASELELSVLMYQRVGNLFVMTGDEKLAEQAKELARLMRLHLFQARKLIGSLEEQQALEDVSNHLDSYLRVRREAESTGEIEALIAATRPALRRTLVRLEAMRDLNDAQVKQAEQQVLRVNRASNRLGVTAGIVFVLALVAVSIGTRNLLTRPLLGLCGGVERFKAGEFDVRVDTGGVREIQALGDRFNDMAQTLASHRERQLTFLAGVAHDLRDPLSTLKMGLYALQREVSPNGEHEGSLDRLERQVESLARMVEDLLDATRIEAGQLDMEDEDFDLRDVVDEMVERYRLISGDHRIEVEVQDAPLVVRGDSGRVEQVLGNLLSNAIKFSPDGGLVRVKLDAEAGEARLRVSDQGVGIAEEDLENIFLPFKRRRPEVAPGAGLGLSIARRIVAAHEGEIDAESELGKGSVFTVHLPLRHGGGDAPKGPGRELQAEVPR